MKLQIFNWMNRKLHPGTDYSLVSHSKDALIIDGGGKGELRSAACEGERDTEALLINHVFDGFLTIGTFGYGHALLLPSTQEEEQQAPPAAEGLRVAGGGGAPAAVEVARHNPPATLPPKEERGVEEEKKRVEGMAAVEEPKRPGCELLEPLLKEDREKDRGRTTLADLLAADAATSAGSHSGKKSPSVAASGGKLQSLCRTKGSKKLVVKGEDSSPAITKKLQRMMTKMLKRKIHPDGVHVRGGASDAGAAGGESHLLPQDHGGFISPDSDLRVNPRSLMSDLCSCGPEIMPETHW